MRLKRKDNQVVKILFLLLILVVGIGYAYLTSNLSITGATSVAGNTWDIHFANVQESSGSVVASSSPTIGSNQTSVEYAVTLSKPGDVYEFSVDIVNGGTLPGKISLTTVSGLTGSAANIVDYSVNYSFGTPVGVDDIINGGDTKTVVVRTLFKEDINEEDLPSSNVTLNLVFSIQFVQSEVDEINAGNILLNLKNEGNTCITKYEGQVTDQVGQTVTAQNVYFDKCADKRNVIFGGFCWQVIRTTETGGLKMIYNGEPVDGKCESSRSAKKGISGIDILSQAFNTNYLYGDSFTYDTTNNTFTLTNTFLSTWSGATYEDLIGKYTCKNTTGTCTTLYNVNGYSSDATAVVSSYRITNTNVATIGKSTFNSYIDSPAMVGYMFNKVYSRNEKQPGTNTYKYGQSFIYDTNTNTYTLTGTTKSISTWNTDYNTINNTHYTCWNTSGICSTISYVYYNNSSKAYYFDMSGGKNVNDILEEMLSNNDVNRYNSSIKGIVDAWYAQNLYLQTIALEDIVYCNDRSIVDLGGWNPSGGNTTTILHFKNYSKTTNITCQNETDQFAVGNNKAKLKFPIALISNEEINNLESTSLMNIGGDYWSISPYNFNYGEASARYVSLGGHNLSLSVDHEYFIRPVVSLKSDVTVSSGTGSETDPWIIN